MKELLPENEKQQLVEILEANTKTIVGLQEMMNVVADRLEALERKQGRWDHNFMDHHERLVMLEKLTATLDGAIAKDHELAMRTDKVLNRLVGIQENRNQQQDAMEHIQNQHTQRLKGVDERLEAKGGRIIEAIDRLFERVRVLEVMAPEPDAFTRAEAARQGELGV